MSTHKKAYPKPVKKTLPRFNKWYAIIFTLFMLAIGTAVYFSRASSATYTWNPSTGAQAGRLFSSDSPLNQPIPADIRYKPDGPQRTATLTDGLTSLLQWSVPVFDADASTPKVRIWCYLTDPNVKSDTCNDINTLSIAVPNGIFPQVGGDGHVEIIDNSARQIYDFWIWKNCFLVANPVNASYCPAKGNHASIDGNGVNGATNVAKLAGGIIRTYEIEQGYIDHALRFSTTNTCGNVRYYPAMSYDGHDMTNTCIPIGSRIQLDPSVNIDAIPGITPFEKIVGHALQKYGAYCDDTGGSFGFSSEYDRTGRQVYTRAGAPTGADGFHFKRIPWDKLKMIEPQWNLDGTKAYAWGNTNVPAPSIAPVPIAPAPTGPGTNGTSAASNAIVKSPQATKQQGNAQSNSSSTNSSAEGESTLTPGTYGDETKLGSQVPIEEKNAALATQISSKIITSLVFVNRSQITWAAVDGATKYQVRVNNGLPKTTTKLTTTIWHFGNGAQQVWVQAIKDDGSYVGDEQALTIKPNCSWYGVCK